MTPEFQTRADQAGNTAKLFCEMVTAASEGLDLEPQDARAILLASNAMAEDLAAMIAGLADERTDQDQLDCLRSLLQDLRSADEMVRRKVLTTSESRQQ